MFPFAIRMIVQTVLVVFVVFVLSTAYGQDRKITPTLNPGCDSCTDNQTLVYIQADGAYDTVHQIWDFTQGIPTVMFILGKINSTVKVQWRERKVVGFELSEKPIYSFAAAITKLIEYDDLDDKGHIDEMCPKEEHSLADLAWSRNRSTLTDKEAMVQMHGHFRRRFRNASIDVKLDLLPFKGFASDLPHLIHTANSTLMDVNLVDLPTRPDYNSSRYALRFVLVSTDVFNSTMHYKMRKSLDDEHTPGVFEIIEIKTPEAMSKEDGGFLQFRPVAYTDRARGVESSTNVRVSNFNRTVLPERSTLAALYAQFDATHLLVQNMTVSFGVHGDGFYKQHNYTSWSLTVGYGSPPVESFSLFVILIISCGLGVPILLALSGAAYVLTRRCRQRNAPTRFTDED